MKFKGNGIVWNPKKNQMLCRFQDGNLDTDDKEIIETLRNLGYKSEDEEETAVSEPEEDCAADNGPDTLPVSETDEAENTVLEPEKTEEKPSEVKPVNTPANVKKEQNEAPVHSEAEPKKADPKKTPAKKK